MGWIVEVSGIDWPGNLTFMLFLSGCNFRCPYCQNSDIVALDSGRETDLSEIEERLKRNLKLIDALGVSGGEPTLQPEAVKKLFTLARRYSLKTFLNTNGSNPSLVEELLKEKLLDHLALDVKAPLDPEIYGEVIGRRKLGSKAVENLLKTLNLCRRYGCVFEARTTVVPGLTDQPEYVRRIAEVLKEYDCIYVVQQFSPYGRILDLRFRSIDPPGLEELKTLAQVAREEGVEKVYVRYRDGMIEIR